MSGFYTSVIIMCWLTLAVLCILIRENDRLAKEEKQLYYLSYALIAAAALAEWLGLLIGGRSGVPQWVLRAVKCADYILTPVAGGALVLQTGVRSRQRRILIGILAANAVFQLVSCFGGWMITIDAQNFYTHGPLYPCYVAVYLVVLLLVVLEFLLYGRAYRKMNRASMYGILILTLCGIALQEIFGGVRTAYLALAIGSALLFIYTTEYAQMAKDDVVQQQTSEIATDALTGAMSRNAYSKALKQLDADGTLPAELVMFLIDIDGLKRVNDTLGHDAGDELICGAAACIESAIGRSYRIGGDEFVVIDRMDRQKAEDALTVLERTASAWHGGIVSSLSLSGGFALAAEHPGLGAEALAREADREMYKAKTRYYETIGEEYRRY